LADGVPADHVVKRIVQSVPLPQVTPRQRSGGFGPGAPGGPVVPGSGGPQGPQQGPWGGPQGPQQGFGAGPQSA
ncbi:MAG: putative ATPase, partial [Klenkia sp.]|nr:putative ATPase [Klenkia sp.]